MVLFISFFMLNELTLNSRNEFKKLIIEKIFNVQCSSQFHQVPVLMGWSVG